MSQDPALQQDLELFRRFLQLVHTIDSTCVGNRPHTPASIDRDPTVQPESQKRADEEAVEVEGEEEDGEHEDEDEEDDYYDAYDDDAYDGDRSKDNGSDDEDDEEFFNYYVGSKAAATPTSPTAEETKPPIPAPATSSRPAKEVVSDDADLRCWDHGCNGKKFTTRSNLRRHIQEKARARPACQCPRCGASFTRTTARNTHIARRSCNRIRRYSNGRIRPGAKESEK
ncbi:hypothetical protein BJY04DRAFT_224762 [Aspergillus karnatakaensis]|uniref:uncharacterized protein n=1 Tax=Aspergillus karnatakaensis TaxID=1810916 RepID=UPI003CCDC342